MKRLIGASLLALTCLTPSADAQVGASGFSPCAANTLSVSGSSSNVQLSTCGPIVYLMNTTSQEAFWTLQSTSGAAVATTAANTTFSYSIPGGAFIKLNVPAGDGQATGYWFAAITAASTTTIRILQGFQQ